ncbi:hypothetical protein NK899_23960, partial [Salmonella enterica subsp. enterica serovar Typhimurium]
EAALYIADLAFLEQVQRKPNHVVENPALHVEGEHIGDELRGQTAKQRCGNPEDGEQSEREGKYLQQADVAFHNGVVYDELQ